MAQEPQNTRNKDSNVILMELLPRSSHACFLDDVKTTALEINDSKGHCKE